MENKKVVMMVDSRDALSVELLDVSMVVVLVELMVAL